MPTRPRRSLRFRVAAAFAGFGAIISVLVTAMLYAAARDISVRLIEETLHAELDDYLRRREHNPLAMLPATATLHGYSRTSYGPGAQVPPEVSHLPEGSYSVHVDGAPHRVLVTDRDHIRYFMLFNEERQRAREQRFLGYLAGGALLMTLFSAAGGFWLARRVIAPVTQLAQAVSRARPDDPPRLTAPNEPGDEIAELAQAFERYLARLHAFIERERAFTSDASHELRTPLAVISGAAEVLADDRGLSEAQRERVARIRRAVGEMWQVIDALLLLAREDGPGTDGPCSVARVVSETVERLRPIAAARGVRVELVIDAEPQVEVPEPLLAIAVSNLVRNAIGHSHSVSVRVEVGAAHLVVSDAGVGIPEQDLEHVFDRAYRGPGSEGSGIGLPLVKRVCERCGWDIRLSSREGAGTVATLRFAPSGTALTLA